MEAIPNTSEASGILAETPPSSPRLGKTLCDGVRINTRAKALQLLSAGLSRGLRVQVRGLWPRNVCAVTDHGDLLEAQLDGDGRDRGKSDAGRRAFAA
jgi:hypothetical protein